MVAPLIRIATAIPKFTPPDDSNLVLWLDAGSDDSVRGLANNDPVTTWFDCSGLGNHVTQAGAASLKPTYKTNQQNGLPALSFDGGDYLINNAIAAYFTGEDKPISIVACLKQTDQVGTDNVVSCGGADSMPLKIPLRYATTNFTPIIREDGGANQVSSAIAHGAGINMHIQSVVCSGTTLSSWTNAVNKQNEVAHNVGTITLNKFAVGTLLYGTSTSNSFDGILAELLVYKSALLNADRTRIQTYLGTKWGITL